MKTGWISLHRKLQENWLWKERRTFSKAEAWIDLLLSSSHEDEKIELNGKKYLIKRGEIINTISNLARDWKWNKSKVSRFLKKLMADKMIKIEAGFKTTRITILNFDDYQILKREVKAKALKKTINDRKEDFKKLMGPYVEKYDKNLLNTFYSYWTEHGSKDRKMRFEKQPSFGMGRRLATFKRNENKRGGNDDQIRMNIPIK